jgi:hypothetical protein
VCELEGLPLSPSRTMETVRVSQIIWQPRAAAITWRPHKWQRVPGTLTGLTGSGRPRHSPHTVVYSQSQREGGRARRPRSSRLRSEARAYPEKYPDRTCALRVTGQTTSSRTVLSSRGRFASKPRKIVLSITRRRPFHRRISRIHLLPAWAQRRSRVRAIWPRWGPHPSPRSL